ncbi:MAG: TIR domain-containing protein [Actinocrinis sp.]
MTERFKFGGDVRFGDNNNLGDGDFHVGDRDGRGAGPQHARAPQASDTDVIDPATRSRNVFVVYGRDEQVREAMFSLLRRLDLHPLEWEDLVRATGHTSPFLGDVVALAPSRAQAALVLLTPDDIVRLHPAMHGTREPDYERFETGQPRPNVLLELGMVLMAYEQRTLIVEVGALRQIADYNGRNVIRFDGSAGSVGKIVERLKLAGCEVDDTGADWRDTRPFEGLDAYGRMP